MPKYRIRYKVGHAPTDATDDVIEVEAATYVTAGNFVDFYEQVEMSVAGTEFPQGAIVYRVQSDIVADIRRTLP